MRTSSLAASSLMALALACAPDKEHASHAGHEPVAPGAAPAAAAQAPTGNVVQQEMVMLTQTLQNAVRAIGLGNVTSIEHDIHRLHGAKEATDAAVRSGSYQLKKNPDKVARFQQLDHDFHEELVKLVVASRKNDVPAAAEALGGILKGCNGCHSEFRP